MHSIRKGIEMDKDVVFVIRRVDLSRALKELQANRGRNSKTDLVYLLVSECAATFRALGTESEYPVHGISPGAAQLPISVLEGVLIMRTTHELELRITEGAVLCGKAVLRNESIALGKIPDLSVSVPIDPSKFELIVIGRVLGEGGVTEQGLQSRLEKAKQELRVAISRAAGILADYRVTESDIELLVEKAVRDAEPNVRKGLSV